MAIKKFARKISLTFCCVGVNVCQHIGKKMGNSVAMSILAFSFCVRVRSIHRTDTGHTVIRIPLLVKNENKSWKLFSISHSPRLSASRVPNYYSNCVSNNLVKYYEVSTDDEKNLFRNWFIVFNLIVENGRVSKLKSEMRVETWRASQWILIWYNRKRKSD